ncbi:SOS response-associated peptidase [Pontixanthobacter aestiaquae]|uniref:SOS response-associated peptidase n=1 Tax=Pontixanthobacter aestiaquae TaxID=1509367 RepID=UPI001F175DB3|nr:SOS response-associated peptidase family protein [Pontixanthobacter aestiaquae]
MFYLCSALQRRYASPKRTPEKSMCNLYRLSQSVTEIAKLFDAGGNLNANLPSHIYPASNGIVIESGYLRSMTWGFPLAQKSKKTGKPQKPKPVNNARTDKLDSFFWNNSFAERRCLIPLSAFAEAQGERGSITRTWMSLADDEVMVCAGVWRDSDEWGPCYSMIMTDASEQMKPIHNRMPVILTAQDRERFIDGDESDALALCTPFKGELEIDQTDEPWFNRK